MDYKELHKKTVAELRQLAKDQYPDIEGTSAMHKDKLVDVLCEQMGIDRHGHHEAVVGGVSIPELKRRMRALKAQSADIRSKGDRRVSKKHRKTIHRLKHRMRRLVEQSPKT